MITRIEKVNAASLKEAREIIFSGGVVAMPTETVYGLGGDAKNDDAVKSIFEIKGRPNDNPLIAHVHEEYDLSKIIDYDPPYEKKLREAFTGPAYAGVSFHGQGIAARFVRAEHACRTRAVA